MNNASNTTLSPEGIKLLRIIMLHVKLYKDAVIKAVLKLTGYQGHRTIFTHGLSTLRSGFSLRSKILHGRIYVTVSVGKRRVKAPTVLGGDLSTVGQVLAVIHPILILSPRAQSN